MLLPNAGLLGIEKKNNAHKTEKTFHFFTLIFVSEATIIRFVASSRAKKQEAWQRIPRLMMEVVGSTFAEEVVITAYAIKARIIIMYCHCVSFLHPHQQERV